jgi:hypothetical protein
MVKTIDEIVTACVRNGVFACRDNIPGSTRILKFIGAEGRWGDVVVVRDHPQEDGRVFVVVDFSRQPAEQQQQ